MTLDELEKAYAEQLPVVIHNPDNKEGWHYKMTGYIYGISPEPTENSTFQEPTADVLCANGIGILVWSHEIRLARLRNPLVIPSRFIHTTSNKYSGNDMATDHRSSRKGLASGASLITSNDEPF